jgi:4-aminobutyrate aminotransferase-like enzyme
MAPITFIRLPLPPWAQLAEMLARITPGKLAVSYRTTGGTESVEGALQIAMAYTGRGKFVSIEDSYHGNSIAAHERRRIAQPRNVQEPPTQLPQDRAAAGSQGAWQGRDAAEEARRCRLHHGANHLQPRRPRPEDEFIRGVRKLCTRYGTLFIADEVATGFGRTGMLFACEHFDLEPDVLCMAKAITGGYGGLGAVITTSKIAKRHQKGLRPLFHLWVAPARRRRRPGQPPLSDAPPEEALKNATQLGEYFLARLSQMSFKGKATIHGKGFAIGIEVKDEDYASEVGDTCREKRPARLRRRRRPHALPRPNHHPRDRPARTRHLRKVPVAQVKPAGA